MPIKHTKACHCFSESEGQGHDYFLWSAVLNISNCFSLPPSFAILHSLGDNKLITSWHLWLCVTLFRIQDKNAEKFLCTKTASTMLWCHQYSDWNCKWHRAATYYNILIWRIYGEKVDTAVIVVTLNLLPAASINADSLFGKAKLRLQNLNRL